MNLEIFSPEKILYRGEATSVTLPGVLGAFTVLDHHAPIISPLVKGEISYRVKEDISPYFYRKKVSWNSTTIIK
jgi:F-type H+-transporting ATPase subunit epsilon